MQETQEADPPEFLDFKDKSAKFLKKTLQMLLSLIAESGRDRFCYVKEALIHPDATCPRPTPMASLRTGGSKHELQLFRFSNSDYFSNKFLKAWIYDGLLFFPVGL